MKSIGVKVVAILLAAVLWWVVSTPRRQRVRERTFSAPLSLVSIPRDMMITTPIPETVDVRLRGREGDLRARTSQSLEVPVDLSWVQSPGEAEITLRPHLVDVPPEIEVVSIEPNKFRFRIEELRQRTVPIRPFLGGELPAGYTAGEANATPERALVSGPSSQILNLTEVATERINMTGRTATFVQSVAVVSDSPLVRIISPLTTQVTVPVLAEVGPIQPPEAAPPPPKPAVAIEKTRTKEEPPVERPDGNQR